MITLEKWVVTQLRATFFVRGNAPAEPKKWWELSFEEPIQQEHRMEPEGRITLVGSVEGLPIQMRMTVGRVDLVSETNTIFPDTRILFPNLGTFDGVVLTFARHALKIRTVNDFPQTTRLAFGIVLALPTTDRGEACSRVESILKFDIGENPQDFLYQINRPRKSKFVDGLTINRLNKWSIMKITHIHGIPVIFGDDLDASGNSQYACRLECDISTATDYIGPFPDSLFFEMVEFARESAVHGDIQ